MSTNASEQSNMSITVEQVQQWLRETSQSVAFGYVQAPLSVPKYERAWELIELALKSREHDRVCYVVHDRLSQVLLTSYCNQRLPRDARVEIMITKDLFGAVGQLVGDARDGKFCTVILEADLNASLEYCWSLVEFMLAMDLTLPCIMAVMVVSDVPLEEVSYLNQALSAIRNDRQSWRRFSMNGRASVPPVTRTTVGSTEEMEDLVKTGIAEIANGEIWVVCCPSDDILYIKAEAYDRSVDFIQIETPRRLLEFALDGYANKRTLIHVSGTRSLVAPLPGLRRVFVFPHTESDVWDDGHILQGERALTECEMNNLVQGHAYQKAGITDQQQQAVETVVVDGNVPSVMPMKELEHSQVYAFVWHLYARRMPKSIQNRLLPVFSQSAHKVREILRRLYWLGCLEEGRDRDSKVVWVSVNGTRSALLRHLLLPLGQDFEAAWFLSSCFDGPMSQATDSVKKLMVRLAVLKTTKTHFDDMLPCSKKAADLEEDQMTGVMEAIVRLNKACNLAEGTISHGWLWSYILLWQESILAAESTALLELAHWTLSQEGSLIVDCGELLRPLEAVEALDEIMCPGSPADLRLEMSADERERILLEMTASWMYSSILLKYGQTMYDASDIVNFDEVKVDILELPPMRFIRPDDAEDGVCFAVPLYLYREGETLRARDIMTVSRRVSSLLMQRFPADNLEEVWRKSY